MEEVIKLRMEEVSLLIDGETFRAKKKILCEHSDYFRAMFSGNYVENEQQEIAIDVIDATNMKIILQYMENDLIDLSDYSLSVIGELAAASNFLQINELIKQIEYTLETQTFMSNWMEILTIAQNACYNKLEQSTITFGLLSFQHMKPEYVPSIHRLFWYLSHPYLHTRNEVEVFKFGLEWIKSNETNPEGILIILGCLDVQRLTNVDIKEIKELVDPCENSLVKRIVDCLLELTCSDQEISISVIIERKSEIIEMFTERVYTEVLNLVRESKNRKLTLTPTASFYVQKKDGSQENASHHMYKYTKQGSLEKWVEVAEKSLWGWSVISWGLTKLVVVGGERGRGTEMHVKDVKVYDTLRNEWIHHGVQLPRVRHAGLAIAKDSLFIIGGVGAFRKVLNSAIIYDLKQRTFRKIEKLHDYIQIPAVCSHEDTIYSAGHVDIYKYEDLGDRDQWIKVVETDKRINYMTSYKGYVYCTQRYMPQMYRFKPDQDKLLELVTTFNYLPAAICNLGDRLIVFTTRAYGNSDVLAVEEYVGKQIDEKPKVLWLENNSLLKVNDVAGSCTLVLSMPLLKPVVASQYPKLYLMRYSES